MRKVLRRLGKREAVILNLRYGLDGGDVHTLAQAGQRMGLTRERVRQLANGVAQPEPDALRSFIDPRP